MSWNEERHTGSRGDSHSYGRSSQHVASACCELRMALFVLLAVRGFLPRPPGRFRLQADANGAEAAMDAAMCASGGKACVAQGWPGPP